MKKIGAIVFSMLISTTVFAADEVVEKCQDRAIKAAETFQNQIVTEMVVNNSSVGSANKTEDGVEYDILSVNIDGTRMRDTLVKLDDWCNVLSVERSDR
ncbi:MAG TPA: hypothetical protein VN132_05050 [Bdellovibrio sp.]|nr:hypothetical protein [Bdellovibrio sp.]